MRETFKLLDLPEPWIVVLVILPLTALVAWIGYAKEPLKARARGTLVVLRFLALLLLLGVLFRPVFVKRREEVKPAEVLLLVDDSASMQRKDAYAGDERVRGALQARTGRAPGDQSRSELVRAALDQALLPTSRRAATSRGSRGSPRTSSRSRRPRRSPRADTRRTSATRCSRRSRRRADAT